MRVPVATYRVQFNQDFRFEDATVIIPDLHRLGISHLYASPIFAARAGSTHGYDVVDPNRLNPVLGTEEDFNSMVAALQERGMGLLLDIVPNHMAASPENAWWMDVLENGAASPYATYFGINWRGSRDRIQDKIFLPVLGAPYGAVLDAGEIRIAYEESGLFLHYYAHRLPVSPSTYGLVLRRNEVSDGEFGTLLEAFQRLPSRVANREEALGRLQEKDRLKRELWSLSSRDASVREQIDKALERFNSTDSDGIDALDELIQQQMYRIAFWKVATERINYRRFFDVSDLIGMRVEQPEVFEAGHRLVFELAQSGKVEGLRIDHIDGLAEPLEYQRRLPVDNLYCVAEKILERSEELPDQWPIHGTSGYDFLGQVNSFFVEPAGLQRLTPHYESIQGSNATFEDIAYQRRLHAIETLFSGEMQDVGAHLAWLAEEDRNARDMSLRDLSQAILEVTACMPVYRTYTNSLEVSESDREHVVEACRRARERNSKIHPLVYDFLERVLTLRFKRWMPESSRVNWLRFVRRWQQLSGPIMAKGVEDSAMYVYNRLISMNEVGGTHEAVSAEQLHAFLSRRQERWPHTMNGTSTHDTKRSEDVRARIHVLSEIPDEWIRMTTRWSRWLADRRGGVDANEEYFLFQTLAGAWPLQADQVEDFRERMKAYVIKASREARTYTSWLFPDEQHEAALQAYVDVLFDDERFQASFQPFRERVAFYGAVNSLSQLLLKVTAPGLPDFYRGTVSWDFSLVDPDNRRPVEFAPLTDFRWRPRDLLDTWTDGRVKIFLTERLLGYRQGNRELFENGEYVPVEVTGKRAGNVFAFMRRSAGAATIVVAPRFTTQLSATVRHPLGIRAWLDTSLVLGSDAPKRWKNVITGAALSTRDGELPLHRVLESFPVALLSAR
ncbi:MAG TPA: malto-oligosyltrehalose synthase [Bryobacteraceae bacterium]|nr:malto-oligosyltrehalose synthase [Bryobacteraceae bacterium]